MNDFEFIDNCHIEEKMEFLKSKAIEYNELSDSDKLKCIDKYTKMMAEKDKCLLLLEKYKNILAPMEQQNILDPIENDTMDNLINKINHIKQRMNDKNIKLSDSFELYIRLTEIKSQMDAHLRNKTLEIIKL